MTTYAPGMASSDGSDRSILATEITSVAHLTGAFVLRSGQTATEYFDKYQFEANPALLSRIAAAMTPLIPDGTEVLAGLEMGGIPVVTALSAASGIPAAFVRKQAKTYGTARLAEGADVAGRRLLVVEDVVTSGGQIVLSTGDLRAAGAIVTQAICVIDRRPYDSTVLADAKLDLIALFTAADLVPAVSRPGR